jgi:pimeloyl-ACP methyl ester carboxylesterase
MKIVHLVQFFQPGYVGGVQRYVAELVHQQRQAGMNVTVFTVELPMRAIDHGSPTLTEGRDQRLAPFDIISRGSWGTTARTPLYPPVIGDLRRLSPDITHVHGPSPWFDLALLRHQFGLLYPPPSDSVRRRLLGEHDPQAVRRLDIPALMIVGDRDEIFPPAMVRLVARYLRNGRVRVTASTRLRLASPSRSANGPSS